MDTDHRELSVMVWGEPHIVTVYRKSETVYEGAYRLAHVVPDRWHEAAKYKGTELGLLHADMGLRRQW